MSKNRQHWEVRQALGDKHYRWGFRAGKNCIITKNGVDLGKVELWCNSSQFNKYRLGFYHGFKQRPENKGLLNWIKWQLKFLFTGKSLRTVARDHFHSVFRNPTTNRDDYHHDED